MWVLEYYGLFYLSMHVANGTLMDSESFCLFSSLRNRARLFESRDKAVKNARWIFSHSGIYCNVRRFDDVEDNEEIARSTGTHTFDFPF